MFYRVPVPSFKDFYILTKDKRMPPLIKYFRVFKLGVMY